MCKKQHNYKSEHIKLFLTWGSNQRPEAQQFDELTSQSPKALIFSIAVMLFSGFNVIHRNKNKQKPKLLATHLNQSR